MDFYVYFIFFYFVILVCLIFVFFLCSDTERILMFKQIILQSNLFLGGFKFVELFFFIVMLFSPFFFYLNIF